MLYAAIAGGAHALRFYREARAREIAASRLQASLTEARLAALRGQLNPHFLFNTLNAISTMALEGDRDRVVRTLGFLADLLRVSLDDHRPQEIALDEELDVLETYLDIQRTRLGERLSVELDVESAARAAMVPSMLLQPLVENAITHGIGRTPGPGTITIRARRRGESLEIDVIDTGPGFDATPAARTTPAARPAAGRGIGLANTRARLAQLYGSRQQLHTDSSHGRGARVSVTLPWQTTATPAAMRP
jgi:sensor histidine kinase YesM